MGKNSNILQRPFYERDTATVARNLLGKNLVRHVDDRTLVGVINEVEAYYGEDDSASHASRGRTPRNNVMFGRPGFSYIYFVYGMHNMFNVVTEPEGAAGAVLIRSVIPSLGVDKMIKNRNGNQNDISNGPARLCQAFKIDRDLNRWDMTMGEKLWIEDGEDVADEQIITAPRIGIHYAGENDRIALLRFSFIPKI